MCFILNNANFSKWLAWSLYKCATLWRIDIGASSTESAGLRHLRAEKMSTCPVGQGQVSSSNHLPSGCLPALLKSIKIHALSGVRMFPFC